MENNDNNLRDEVNQREIEMNDRINRLYGTENVTPINNYQLTEEEKRERRKLIVTVIWVIIIGGSLLIGSFFMPSFKHKETPNVPIVNENETGKTELPDGDVDIAEDIIVELDAMFNINNNHPLYTDNILKLYSANLEVTNLDFETKMLLVTSTPQFKEFMLNTAKLNKYNPDNEQNAVVKFSKESLEKVVKEVLGDDVTLEHKNFKYYYEFTKDKIVYFDVILSNDEYTLKPIQGEKSKLAIYKNLKGAYKMGGTLYLDFNIVFTNDAGIYSDKEMKNLLSTDIKELPTVISRGSMLTIEYQKTFDSEGNSRYVFKNFNMLNDANGGE